jgi:CO/xanthine dehydrogenase FAD-binding subunit
MSGFRYERPDSLAAATALLAGAGGRARVLAGGTDLMVALRSGAVRPELVVDIKRIPGLEDIAWDGDGTLVLGACVIMQRVADDARIRDTFPALAEGAGEVGSLQIRARATIAGNLANASPCMDTAPPLLVHDARLRIEGPAGRREAPLADFFLGVRRTALTPDEIVTAVVVPPPAAGVRSGFDKIKRVAGHDLALVNAALAWDPTAATLRVAVGSCAVTPAIVPPLGNVPEGADPARTGDRLAALAQEHILPIDDVRASAEYRRDMTAALCRRLTRRLLGGPRRAS